MSRIDTLPELVAVKADLDAGIAAIRDMHFDKAHGTLLVLFLAPGLPAWFRDMFCMEPMRELARAYLPTRAALRRMRDRTARRLSAGDQCAALLHKALLLNDALDHRHASQQLLVQLDVIAGSFLATCGEAVISAFAACADPPRARKYLGDHRAAIARLADSQNEICSARKHRGAWPLEQLAQCDQFVRKLGVIARVLRANGEDDAAARVRGRALLRIADPAYRNLIAQEQLEPGHCQRELLAWLDLLGEPQGYHLADGPDKVPAGRAREHRSQSPSCPPR